MNHNPFSCLFQFIALIVSVFLIIAAIGFIAMVNQRMAVDSAFRVSPDLGNEASAAQRLSNDESVRVDTLAHAEKENKDGSANLTIAQANANKLNAEARTIEDDRQAKKYGYGGLALADLFGQFGSLGLLCGFSSFAVIFLVGFMSAIRLGAMGK